MENLPKRGGYKCPQVCETTGQDLNERTTSWISTPLKRLDKPESFSNQVTGLIPGNQYEFRAVVQHPLLKVYGDEMKLNTKR